MLNYSDCLVYSDVSVLPCLAVVTSLLEQAELAQHLYSWHATLQDGSLEGITQHMPCNTSYPSILMMQHACLW